MGAAALPTGPSKHRGDGVLQPLVSIGGDQFHSASLRGSAVTSSITATTCFALRARYCAGVRTTKGNATTSTWRVRRIARPAPSGTPASRQGKSGGSSASRYITRSIPVPGSGTRLQRRDGSVAGVRPSWKGPLLPWTVWDGTNLGCVDSGRCTVKGTCQRWTTTCRKWCGDWAVVSGRLVQRRPLPELSRMSSTP